MVMGSVSLVFVISLFLSLSPRILSNTILDGQNSSQTGKAEISMIANPTACGGSLVNGKNCDNFICGDVCDGTSNCHSATAGDTNGNCFAISTPKDLPMDDFNLKLTLNKTYFGFVQNSECKFSIKITGKSPCDIMVSFTDGISYLNTAQNLDQQFNSANAISIFPENRTNLRTGDASTQINQCIVASDDYVDCLADGDRSNWNPIGSNIDMREYVSVTWEITNNDLFNAVSLKVINEPNANNVDGDVTTEYRALFTSSYGIGRDFLMYLAMNNEGTGQINADIFTFEISDMQCVSYPTRSPTLMPSTYDPTKNPTFIPSFNPSNDPTFIPSTYDPTMIPTMYPTLNPTTDIPTTHIPTTTIPSTDIPTTDIPTTTIPSETPTTDIPTLNPTNKPTTYMPSTSNPTSKPTTVPSTNIPTTDIPTGNPTSKPTSHIQTPTNILTTAIPSITPTLYPTNQPTTDIPSVTPSSPPTSNSATSTSTPTDVVVTVDVHVNSSTSDILETFSAGKQENTAAKSSTYLSPLNILVGSTIVSICFLSVCCCICMFYVFRSRKKQAKLSFQIELEGIRRANGKTKQHISSASPKSITAATATSNATKSTTKTNAEAEGDSSDSASSSSTSAPSTSNNSDSESEIAVIEPNTINIKVTKNIPDVQPTYLYNPHSPQELEPGAVPSNQLNETNQNMQPPNMKTKPKQSVDEYFGHIGSRYASTVTLPSIPRTSQTSLILAMDK